MNGRKNMATNKPNFTPQQKKAIELRDRNILVSASAGAGKTAVLTERIVSLLLNPEKPVDIDRMIVVTFTRAAAAEMRSRIAAKLNERLTCEPGNRHIEKQLALLPHAQITTIDSFCLHIVRNYFYTISLDPAFRIGDEQEMKLLREDVMEELLEERYSTRTEAFVKMVETLSPGKSDDKLRDTLYTLYRYSESHSWPEKWLKECLETFGVDSAEEVFTSKWFIGSGVLSHMKNVINNAYNYLNKAYEMSRRYPELEKISLHIMENINEVKPMLDKDDYISLSNWLRQCDFGRYPGLKTVIDEQPQIKSLRDKAKDGIYGIRDEFCYAEAEDIFEEIHACKDVMEELIALTIDFSRRFAACKEENNVLDFSDVEHMALKILYVEDENGEMQPSEAAEDLMSQYEYILIDEYQDSNDVQETILTGISRERTGNPNMFMVGDVKQSIYQFRLAKPDIFEAKRISYTDEDSKAQRVMLKNNFRSSAAILQTVNYLFSKIMKRELGNVEYDESHEFAVNIPENEEEWGSAVDVMYICPTSADDSEADAIANDEISDYGKRELEALAIAKKIEEMTHSETGLKIYDKTLEKERVVRYSDIVILLRSMSGWAEDFVQTLTSKGIPAYAQERTGYFSAKEIQTIISMLRIIDNPHQDIPLTVVLKSVYAGFSDEELAIIKMTERDTDMYSAIVAMADTDEKCRAFVDKLNYFRNMAPYVKVHELIEALYETDDFIGHMEAMPSGEIRRANLMMLVDKALAFEGTDNKGLFRFIHYIDKLQKADIDFGEVKMADGTNGAVTIMSIHKSKGLEFPVAFVSGLGKQFNLMDARRNILVHSEYGIGADYFNPGTRIKKKTLLKKCIARKIVNDSLGEELRVLYVALTRPKDKLILTGVVAEDFFEGCEKNQGTYEDMISGKVTFFDWLTPWFMHHPSWNIGCGLSRYEEGDNYPYPPMTFQIVNLKDIVMEEGVGAYLREQKKKMLLELADNTRKVGNVANTDNECGISDLLKLRRDYVYPYECETKLPVKVSVSDIKHRAALFQDEESVAADWVSTERPEYIPSFMKEETEEVLTGAARGTIYHTLMQNLYLPDVGSVDDIKEIVNKLTKKGVLPENVLENRIISANKVYRFCVSEVAKRMAKAQKEKMCYVEQPFVMGIPANEVYSDTESKETLLVQGIIDVFFEEEDGIVLLDYKTDRLLPGEEEKLIGRYSAQMQCYKSAIEQSLGKKVKEIYLYSFSLDKEIKL